MMSYRPDKDTVAVGPSSSIAVNPPSQFLQLMIDYDDEQADQDISFSEETIDEEYTGYVSSLPKRAVELDPLKFWEVSIYNCHSCYFTDIYNEKNTRQTAKLSRLSSK
jgi:hypothetical protein